MQGTLNAAPTAHGDGTRTPDNLIGKANNAGSGEILKRLGKQVAKGNRFECPTCKSYPPSATFADEAGNLTSRWHCTSCCGGGSVVDLVALVRGYSDTNAARSILGLPTVTADIGQDHADEIITSIDSANAVENELPTFVGSDTRAEKKLMRKYSPSGSDGPRASGGSAANDLFERAKAVPLADVVDRLGLNRKGHKFLCPFHDDHNPSADFRDSATGNAHSHWQCFSCQAKGSGIDLVVKKIGGDPANAARWILNESSPSTNGHAARPKAASKPSEPAKVRPPKVHETPDKAIRALLYSVRREKGENWHVVGGWRAYCNSAGEVALGVVRFEGGKGEKTFRQFSRQGDGWIARGLSSGIPPFRLADLDKATPLVVVEGEKACEAAWEIGLQSTTWAGGAKAVGKTDWSLLAGFDVIVWPDADEPGRKAAADVAKSLHGVAARVRILPDDPDAAEGDDAADVLAKMGAEKALHYFEDRLERATDWTPPQPAKSSFPQPGNGKPQVIFPLSYNEPSKLFAEIIPHLPDAGVYYRDGSLCRIIKGDSVNIRGVGELSVSGPMIDPHDADSILPVLCDTIDFWAERQTKKEIVPFPATPKAAFLRWFLRLRNWPGTPYLTGIASGPFLRHDGAVCTTPGYDAESGWYLDYNGEPIEVPDRPTQKQAEDACRTLLALVDQFEWKSEPQKCGFLAYLLTLIARPGIAGAVPAFVFTASTPGAGKTLLANVANIIAFGHSASGYSPPQARHESDAAEEWKKMLFAFAMTGNPSLVVSNYPSGKPVGNAAIDGMITDMKVIGRPLGTSKTKESAWVATMAFTGNNLSSTADFSFRSIWSVLEPSVENPRERTGFKIGDLEGFARENRANYLRKALIILRWHAANAKPHADGKHFGSFERWAETVRDPIMHLTGHDVTQNSRDAVITDHESDELGTLLAGLHEYFEWRKAVGKPQTSFAVAELHGDLTDPTYASAWPDLREVVDASLSLKAFNTTVGRLLTKYKGRVSGGLRLNATVLRRKPYWRIDTIKSP